MNTDLVPVVGAIVAFLTALGALIKVTYDKPKAVADAEAQRLANASYPATEMRALYATVQQRLAHVEAELESVRKSYNRTQNDLDAALDRIGILSQENRAWAQYHADVTAQQKVVADQMRAAGMDIPEPPAPPHPRTEFTRRTDFTRDFPTREEFEQTRGREADGG